MSASTHPIHTPVLANRGQPFRMIEDNPNARDYDGAPPVERFHVIAPGFEDWQYLALIKKASGWRAYSAEIFTSYSTAYGHGGHCIHERLHAIRDADTGKPLPSRATAQEALEQLQALFLEGEVMPA